MDITITEIEIGFENVEVVKRVECRTPRRFKGDISNGSEYKRLPMNHAH